MRHWPVRWSSLQQMEQTSSTVARWPAGPLARLLADDARRAGGPLTLEDLADFQVRRNAPLVTGYRGLTVALPAPPAGGVVVAEMLRILERFDVTAMGHNSAEYVRTVAETVKIDGRDREEHIGDPDFAPPPPDHLLSDRYADENAPFGAARRRRWPWRQASPRTPPPSPAGMRKAPWSR